MASRGALPVEERRVLPNRYGLALAFAFATVMVGCTLHRSAALAPVPSPTGGDEARSEIATASWYGAQFHGRRTASGEIFDQHGLSAASPSLPLGTHVRVTNLDNGRAVQLRITDRGPFVPGRRLDVSYGAARRLGMVTQGTSRVRIEILERPAVPVALRAKRGERDRSRRRPGRRRPSPIARR